MGGIIACYPPGLFSASKRPSNPVRPNSLSCFSKYGFDTEDFEDDMGSINLSIGTASFEKLSRFGRHLMLRVDA